MLQQYTATLTIVISLLLLAAALTQKAFDQGSARGAADGGALFFMGWLGPWYGGAGWCWMANPALLASLWCMKQKPLVALACSALALALAAMFRLFTHIVADEAGNYAPITSYRTGYWLWLAGMGTSFAGNIASCTLNY